MTELETQAIAILSRRSLSNKELANRLGITYAQARALIIRLKRDGKVYTAMKQLRSRCGSCPAEYRAV